MKEAARFWLQNMVEYEGKYIIAPTVSSEHGVDIRDGKPVEYAITNGEATKDKWLNLPGAFQDIQMVNDLYSNVIQAAEILGVDKDFVAEVKATREQYCPCELVNTGKFRNGLGIWTIPVTITVISHICMH